MKKNSLYNNNESNIKLNNIEYKIKKIEPDPNKFKKIINNNKFNF